MKLGSLIQKEYILTGDKYSSVMEAVDALIEIFAKNEKFPVSMEKIQEIVLERERLGGTVIPPGIAIPHGRIDGYEDILIGMWIPSKTLETDQGDVKVLMFFLTSKAGSSLYLPMLSSLGKYFGKEEFLDSLLGLSAQQIHDLLNTMDIKKEITIEDIMTVNPVSISKQTTLAQLADLFYQKNLSYIPVVDENNVQIGEVTIKDLFSRGIPDYVKRLGYVSFLKTLEPFEALLREEDRILVQEIMRPPSRKISKEASIIEAVMMITTKDVRHIPVIEDKKLVGMVCETDILKKVLRA
ncbi:CBS domain-containing protein [Oceanispirochaeta crateris]|nr:CBS domain-containing protein [Oceanispirochaeta crateris]